MIAKVMTAAVLGLEARLVEVETVISNGLPSTTIVGLPDTAVQESRERVRAALRTVSDSYPQTRVTINLAPADVPKVGPHFDVPIALAILLASETVKFSAVERLFVGELALDGSLRSSAGVLAIARFAAAQGYKELYVPAANAAEAALVTGLRVFAVSTLAELLAHVTQSALLKPVPTIVLPEFLHHVLPVVDMSHIAGQFLAKRALVIAAAGQHNVRLFGPPGSGKTLLVQAMAGLLPNMSLAEVLELTTIYSVAGQLPHGVMAVRPVRSPHHTSSIPALIGGGSIPRPGEITLAHRGILFLDELPEFSRSVLETLRQPLESGTVTITRAKTAVTFPARFTLVAAQNPCPCGFYGDNTTRCTCSPGMLYRYQNKVSGPLLDRFDLHVLVPRTPYKELLQTGEEATSAAYKAMVVAARDKQLARFGEPKTNAEMSTLEIQQYCQLDARAHELLEKVADSYDLSARGVHRLLKVARTIADLADADNISAEHMMEAVQYRLTKPGA